MIGISRYTHAVSNRDGEIWDCKDCERELVEVPSGSNQNVLYVQCPSCESGIGLDTDKVHPAESISVVIQR